MSTRRPDWMFDEFAPVGVDLDSRESVATYERRQGVLADEDDALLDRLGVASGTRLADLGTGTGSLPIRAAARGAHAAGIDVSESMLAFARERAAEAGVSVDFRHGGFLTHDLDPGQADVVTTRAALHQLPDTWKQVALTRAARLLRPGGTLYLRDVVWSFPPEAALEGLPAWIDAMARPAGEGFTRADFATHVREEFSTFAWVLEGLVERAGLVIEEARYPSPWYGEILARR